MEPVYSHIPAVPSCSSFLLLIRCPSRPCPCLPHPTLIFERSCPLPEVPVADMHLSPPQPVRSRVPTGPEQARSDDDQSPCLETPGRKHVICFRTLRFGKKWRASMTRPQRIKSSCKGESAEQHSWRSRLARQQALSLFQPHN